MTRNATIDRSACVNRRQIVGHSETHVEEREGRISIALDELGKATEVWETCNPPQPEDLARNLELRAEVSDHLRLRIDANHLRKRAQHIVASIEDQAAVSSN